MPILILGGTGEARALAAQLTDSGIEIVSSLAGRVQNPAMPVGEVVLGGFGGAAGLAEYLRENDVNVVVDATHPFAATITANAVTAATTVGAQLLVLRRPEWVEHPDDQWFTVDSTPEAAAAIVENAPLQSTIFLTTGRRDVTAFAHDTDRLYLIRSVDPPTVTLPSRHELILDRGPYSVEGERMLLLRHNVHALVTKNSGGDMTYAKIVAARELALPVIVVNRPPSPAGTFDTVGDVESALRWCHEVLGQDS